MTAEVIAVGSELSCGSRLDTNSQWLSQELEALGWSVTRHTTLSDDMDLLVSEFRAAAQRSQVVLITGGLGPTLDDITRDALAAAFRQPLITDPVSLQQIQAIFAARGRDMPERNQRQAQRPAQASPLPNRCGTAPGILLRVPLAGPQEAADRPQPTALLAALPGVPAEMKVMFAEQVLPQLPGSGAVISRSLLRTFGYGESDAERLLGDLTARGRNPEVGITASEAVISLSVTARAASAAASQEMLAAVVREIHERLGSAVFCEGFLDLHDVVGAQLAETGQRVALLEGSTTGGLLACWLTENPQHAANLSFGRVEPTTPRTLAAAASAADWEAWARTAASAVLQSGAADFVLLSSAFQEAVSDQGVAVKRGFVALAGQAVLEIADVSMSGNLAIFRQRAARTALNRLRLHLNQHSTQPAD